MGESFLSLPEELRWFLLACIGLMVGGQINRGVYSLAWDPRPISPWSKPPGKGPRRRWQDKIPVWGWWGLRREAKIHGAGFWIRPMLVEVACGVGLPALYIFEMSGGLIPEYYGDVGVREPRDIVLQARFFSHAVLIGLMLVASLIDIDEKTIPDAITLPGTIIGLLLAAGSPSSLLPEPISGSLSQPAVVYFLRFTPHPSVLTFSPWLFGILGLAIGMICFAGWWFAILPKTIYWTGTWSHLPQALSFFFGSIRRNLFAWRHPRGARGPGYLALILGGLLGMLIVWGLAQGDQEAETNWESLLTALVGMAFGGGLIWSVRVIGFLALRREAMGYGDVTLMSMIGAFLGWQAVLVAFFLAPFAGIVIAGLQYIFTRQQEIWFGPFLCAGSLVTILYWAPIWEGYGRHVFFMGWLVPGVLGFCLLLMGGMLWIWQLFKERFLFADEEEEAEGA